MEKMGKSGVLTPLRMWSQKGVRNTEKVVTSSHSSRFCQKVVTNKTTILTTFSSFTTFPCFYHFSGFYQKCQIVLTVGRGFDKKARIKPVKTTKNLSRRRGAVNIFRARHQQCRSNEELRCVQIALQTRVHGDIQSGRRRHAQALLVSYQALAPRERSGLRGFVLLF